MRSKIPSVILAGVVILSASGFLHVLGDELRAAHSGEQSSQAKPFLKVSATIELLQWGEARAPFIDTANSRKF